METKELEFTRMILESKSTIYTVCYMFSKDKEEIDDLFQDIIVRLWKGYGSFEGKSDIKTWIYRVSLNCCLDQKRNNARRVETVPLDVSIDPFEGTDDKALQTRQLYNRINKLGLMDKMENPEINGTNELEELRKEYISAKENFAGEHITDADSVGKSVRLGLNGQKLAKRRWLLLSIGGMAAFAAALPFVYDMVKSPVLLVSTGIIILLYGINAFLSDTSRLDSLYGEDNAAFIKSVKRNQSRQYWFIRIYLVAFCFWAGFMITLPFVKLDSGSEKLAFLAVLLPFLGVNLFTTVRMHNIVIGAYEGLLFDNSDVRETLGRTYYSEDAIRDRRRRTAKRKYATCIVMIFVMSAFFVWQLIKVLKGGGIASTLPIYPIFVVIFVILARENKKEC